jgi:Tfp pilus assembly protein FimV
MIKQYQTAAKTTTETKPRTFLDKREDQRVTQLESRIHQLQSLVELQDRQLRRLQSQLDTLTETLRRGR